MQWEERTKKKRIYPEDNEIRTVHRFLYIPLKINGLTKWLEFASYEEEYRYGMGCIDWPDSGYSYHDFLGEWYPLCWVD